MKYVKRLNLNRKRPESGQFSVEIDQRIETNSITSTQLPAGTKAQRSTTAKNGQLRYSKDLNEIEALVNGNWEIIKTVRQPYISFKTYSGANYQNTIFGPLEFDCDTSKPQNIQVFIENVPQLPDTTGLPGNFNVAGNYRLVYSPSVVTTLSAPVVQGAVTLSLVSLTDIQGGISQRVSGAGIAPGTVVQSIANTLTNTIRISNPTSASINTTTNLAFAFSTGTYVQFTGAAPSKAVYTIQGMDGYGPNPAGLFDSN
jgi:hypothetical protein